VGGRWLVITGNGVGSIIIIVCDGDDVGGIVNKTCTGAGVLLSLLLLSSSCIGVVVVDGGAVSTIVLLLGAAVFRVTTVVGVAVRSGVLLSPSRTTGILVGALVRSESVSVSVVVVGAVDGWLETLGELDDDGDELGIGETVGEGEILGDVLGALDILGAEDEEGADDNESIPLSRWLAFIRKAASLEGV
jgi:hypothetical protein